jgi:hypothetical protein
LTALTYLGVGLFVLGWLVLFVLSLSSKSEYDIQNKQVARSNPKIKAQNTSETAAPQSYWLKKAKVLFKNADNK